MYNTGYMATQPILHGIRILDFSWVLAGPYATRLLADFGAEVIKVQPLLPEAEDKFSQGYYNTWNRNKLGITLNLGKPEGIEIAKKLVKISDAVVENFSPRVMVNWGLDYPELRKLKPDIILLSMSVMGHTGPWRNYTGFGPTVQAFSGITYLTSYPDQPPLGIGVFLCRPYRRSLCQSGLARCAGIPPPDRRRTIYRSFPDGNHGQPAIRYYYRLTLNGREIETGREQFTKGCSSRSLSLSGRRSLVRYCGLNR